MYKFKIGKLLFNDGTEYSPSPITVFVGPNNAGKSRALRNIVEHLSNAADPSLIVHGVEFHAPQSLEDLKASCGLEAIREPGGMYLRRLMPDLIHQALTSLGGLDVDAWLSLYSSTPERFRQEIGPLLVSYLSTENRLKLLAEAPSVPGPGLEGGLLRQLYDSGPLIEKEISGWVRRAFSLDARLDYSTLDKLRMRTAADFGSMPEDPRKQRPLMEGFSKLDEQGDGLRAFVGILVALMAVRRDVVLVDEPEAFLHPPQSYRMGEVLAEQARNDRQIIVATHSTDILRGILAKQHTDLTIIRIARQENVNSFTMLKPADLTPLVTDPLLSSARVLDGLFYRACVVVEGDSDARFYQYASRRLDESLDLHFVNADNKQTVPRVMDIYRRIGVPSAGIVDVDVLNDEDEFRRQLEAIGCPSDEVQHLLKQRAAVASTLGRASVEERHEQLRTIIRNAATAADGPPTERMLTRVQQVLRAALSVDNVWGKFKATGRAGLASQEEFDDILSRCAARGLFINPTGELESMLFEVGIEHTTDKRSWIQRALPLLRELRSDTTKQPWKFINAIHSYLIPLK